MIPFFPNFPLIDIDQTNLPTDGLAFSVGLHYDPTNLTVGDTLKFDYVKTNIGNLYDKRTGLFRALVPGVYVFYVNAMTYDDQWVELQIMKNDEALVYLFSRTNSGYRENASNMVITTMKAGDDAYVRVFRAQYTGPALDDFTTTFSGFLLFKTN